MAVCVVQVGDGGSLTARNARKAKVFPMITDQPAFLPPGTSAYQDERALATYLSLELERRLAGRDQPMLVRQAPGDVCHLGVLAPVGAHDASPATNDGTTAADVAGGGHMTSTTP